MTMTSRRACRLGVGTHRCAAKAVAITAASVRLPRPVCKKLTVLMEFPLRMNDSSLIQDVKIWHFNPLCAYGQQIFDYHSYIRTIVTAAAPHRRSRRT